MCSTANRAYEQGLYYYKLGDEEKAYTLFMKYLNIIHVIRDSDEYNNNKTEINTLLNNVHITSALNYAEELSQSLSNRYYIVKYSHSYITEINLPEEVSFIII